MPALPGPLIFTLTEPPGLAGKIEPSKAWARPTLPTSRRGAAATKTRRYRRETSRDGTRSANRALLEDHPPVGERLSARGQAPRERAALAVIDASQESHARGLE